MQFILLGKDKRYNFDIVSRLLDKITLKKPSEFHSYTSGKAFIEPKTKNILLLIKKDIHILSILIQVILSLTQCQSQY